MRVYFCVLLILFIVCVFGIGLDSASALMVGEILSKLSKNKNMTILCTIHQPRYSLAKMFDKLYFLADGKELYFGPSIPKALNFFKSCGYPCPEYDNPADFLLDLVNTSNNRQKKNNRMEKREEIIDKLHKFYLASDLFKDALNFEISPENNGLVLFKKISNKQYITPFYNQFSVILIRSFLHKFREPIALMTQIFTSVVTPIIFGSVYWQLNLSQAGALDRLNAISLQFMMVSFFAMDILALFPMERLIFIRESEAGMYGPLMFYLGRSIAEIPQHIILLLFQGLATYFMFGFQLDLDKCLIYCVLVVLTGLAGTGMLLMCSALTKTFEQANMATFIMLLLMLFNGSWISLDQIPVYYKWLRYLSYIGYGSQGASVNEYKGLKFKCTQEEINNNDCLFPTGEDVLKYRGMQNVDILNCIILLIILQIGYRFVAFIAFWLLHRGRKTSTIIKQTFGCIE